jgi:hypothetical protein
MDCSSIAACGCRRTTQPAALHQHRCGAPTFRSASGHEPTGMSALRIHGAHARGHDRGGSPCTLIGRPTSVGGIPRPCEADSEAYGGWPCRRLRPDQSGVPYSAPAEPWARSADILVGFGLTPARGGHEGLRPRFLAPLRVQCWRRRPSRGAWAVGKSTRSMGLSRSAPPRDRTLALWNRQEPPVGRVVARHESRSPAPKRIGLRPFPLQR